MSDLGLLVVSILLLLVSLVVVLELELVVVELLMELELSEFVPVVSVGVLQKENINPMDSKTIAFFIKLFYLESHIKFMPIILRHLINIMTSNDLKQ